MRPRGLRNQASPRLWYAQGQKRVLAALAARLPGNTGLLQPCAALSGLCALPAGCTTLASPPLEATPAGCTLASLPREVKELIWQHIPIYYGGSIKSLAHTCKAWHTFWLAKPPATKAKPYPSSPRAEWLDHQARLFVGSCSDRLVLECMQRKLEESDKNYTHARCQLILGDKQLSYISKQPEKLLGARSSHMGAAHEYFGYAVLNLLEEWLPEGDSDVLFSLSIMHYQDTCLGQSVLQDLEDLVAWVPPEMDQAIGERTAVCEANAWVHQPTGPPRAIIWHMFGSSQVFNARHKLPNLSPGPL